MKNFITVFMFLILISTACFSATDPNNITKETIISTENLENEPNDVPKIDKPEIKEIASDFDLALQRHSVELGSEFYSYTYEEPSIMEDKGVFYGGLFNYTFRGWVPASPNEPLKPESGSFKTEFRFASGEADYDGALSDDTPYTIDDIEYNTYETRFLLGLDQMNDDCIASLYTGFGYRYSTDDSSFDPYGYERESNYFYVPIIYQLDGKFENNQAWGCKFEVDILAWGKQKSYLSDVGGPDIENEQDKGYGLRGSIRIQNKIGTGVLTLEPFIRYWSIEDSDIDKGYYEPENNTTEVGLQLLWKF